MIICDATGYNYIKLELESRKPCESIVLPASLALYICRCGVLLIQEDFDNEQTEPGPFRLNGGVLG